MERIFEFEGTDVKIVTPDDLEVVRGLIDTTTDYCKSLSQAGIDLIHVRVRLADVAEIYWQDPIVDPLWVQDNEAEIVVYPDGTFSFAILDDFTEPVSWEKQ